jgi:hypothetical protein
MIRPAAKEPRRDRLDWRTWAGLATPPCAWLVHHQVGSELNFADCGIGNGVLALAVGVIACGLSLLGLAWSFAAWRSAGRADTVRNPVAQFMAALGLLLGGLLTLTILMQIAASLIVPACFR